MNESEVIKLDNATFAMFDNKLASDIVSGIYVIVALFSLTGNSISLFLLLMRTSPKTPTIIFMINLTLTDLMLGIVLPFQIVYQMQGYNWTLGTGMCNVLTVTFYTNMYCSILSMTAISADRYLGIVKPMRFREMRKRKRFAVIACILMWLMVLGILSPLERSDLTYYVKERDIVTCFDVLRSKMLPSIAHWAGFLFGMFILLFLVPFIITVYCYVNIIWVLVRKTNSDQKGRAVRLACIVLFVFTFCFAPNNILLLAHTVARLYYGKSLYIYYKLSLSLSCINSCADPFIYYFASKEFRRKLRQMLRLQTLSTAETQMIEGHRESFFSGRTTCNAHEDCDNM
ncbi:S-geranylgeranyl-glutathione receptor P2RY8 [Danio rerio]|uniref:P2Y purinoceptor 8 n=2 Tax=Danio rerio TaxID=7955 RepID=A0A8N7TBG0_DANRE|nr:P2Y purinoceptor 8 [Danio rerio]XP_694859.3 P2Y purinoceptor 8 [Danio rerio]|eukprot:XP_021327880.1 P2Y purinoceptor 8 [Danio rerio]